MKPALWEKLWILWITQNLLESTPGYPQDVHNTGGNYNNVVWRPSSARNAGEKPCALAQTSGRDDPTENQPETDKSEPVVSFATRNQLCVIQEDHEHPQRK